MYITENLRTLIMEYKLINFVLAGNPGYNEEEFRKEMIVLKECLPKRRTFRRVTTRVETKSSTDSKKTPRSKRWGSSRPQTVTSRYSTARSTSKTKKKEKKWRPEVLTDIKIFDNMKLNTKLDEQTCLSTQPISIKTSPATSPPKKRKKRSRTFGKEEIAQFLKKYSYLKKE